MGHHKPIGGVTPFLKIQEGVWADVYKAYDTSLDRYVLLKVLHDRFRHDADLAEQFAQEARLMAKVQHPNVVQILAFGEDQQQVYLTTAFVEGQSLRNLIDAQGALPAPIAVNIAHNIARGLHAAHNQAILHRDLKPANVLIANDGQVKLTDFGLATLKQPDQAPQGEPAMAGTPAYLAPECITDASVSVQSDLFALGATLIEMLTGKAAFRGEDSRALFDSLLHYDPITMLPQEAAMPKALVALCGALLDKNPDNRPKTAKDVAGALDQIVALFSAHQGTEEVQRFLASPEAYEAPKIKAPASNSALAESTDVLNQAEDRPTQAPGQAQPGSRRVRRVGFLGLAVLAIFTMFALRNLQNGAETTPVTAPTEQVATAEVPAPQTSSEAATSKTVTSETVSSETVSSRTVTSAPDENVVTPSDPVSLPVDRAEVPAQASPIKPAKEADTAAASPLLAVVPDDTDSLANEAARAEQMGNLTVSGNLTVLCTPWCDVSLDGVSLGAAPPAVSYTTPAGNYTLELSNPHYPTFAQDIILSPGQSDTLRLAFNDFVASVDLEILPWAEVSIDSVNYGTLPPNKTILLAPGTHTIVLKNSELGEWQGTLIVAAGEKRRQPYNLHELLDK